MKPIARSRFTTLPAVSEGGAGSGDDVGRGNGAGRALMRAIILAAILGLAIVGCDSGTEAEVGPRLTLTVDTTAYLVGGIGELRLVNEDTMTVRYRSLYCAPVERSGPGGWEALGRVFETWEEELPGFTEGCGFLTRGFDNIGPGEVVTEIFELREFMGVEGTYRISTFETQGERFYVSQEFTVEAAGDGG